MEVRDGRVVPCREREVDVLGRVAADERKGAVAGSDVEPLALKAADARRRTWRCCGARVGFRLRRLRLMTDGGESPRTSKTAASAAGPQSNWTVSRVIGMVFASIGGLIGLALLAGGIAVLAAYAFGRDDDGYFSSDRKRLESATYAIATEDIDLGADEVDWAPDKILGNVRVRVDSEKPVFVGVGPEDEVDRYLGDVAHDELIDFEGDDPEFEPHEGGEPRAPPGDQDFWVAESQGSGEQALTWDAEFGRWTAVVMNADAARGIDIEADVGVKLDWAIWAGLGAFVVGLLMTVGAVIVILLIGRRSSPTGRPAD
jgi:hypothetical protein